MAVPSRLLPFFSSDALTTTAIISGVVSVLAMLLGGLLGGLLGERWHRKADFAVAAGQGHAVATDRRDVRGTTGAATPHRDAPVAERVVDATPDGSLRSSDGRPLERDPRL